jgi:hypothetical protein
LNSAMQELARVYSTDDTFFKYTAKTTEFFIKDIITSILTLEIHYLMNLKENIDNSKRFNKKEIIGEMLSYNLDNENIKLNDIELTSLLDSIGLMVQSYAILLRMNNSEWLETFMKKHQEHLLDKIYSERAKNKRMSKQAKAISKVGRPCRFISEGAFHKKIKSIPNWESLLKTELAQRLGYKSSSGLNELLKSKNWKLPK